LILNTECVQKRYIKVKRSENGKNKQYAKSIIGFEFALRS